MPHSFQLSPYFLYGTAWKEEESARLTFEALQSGFRGIDTANQRRHYHEEGVGEGIKRFLHNSSLRREDLFLQTKYTFAPGQDHRKPYDEDAEISTQVRQSFEKSLLHLQTPYIDCLVLHGPYTSGAISEPDWQAWQAMETLAQEGKVRFLGVSNCHLEQIVQLVKGATVKPTFLQNRCYATTLWDRKIREFCSQYNIIYQGFSLLTANANSIVSGEVKKIAQKYSKTIPQIIFRFSLDLGMLPLTGTTQKTHMLEDLQIFDFELTREEIEIIERIAP